ncbi:MAG: rRNA pseudouridine synthase [Clostridia bacterium]|nr:rRNA pseudouridine synthase [Clostridia bacterium]
MRLDKYICSCGSISRRDVKKLIKQGLVTVNGTVCKKADEQIAEDSVVAVGRESLVYRKYVYFMLNKPSGYVSAVYDKKYPVVTELVGEAYAHFEVFPVGRLDIDTEGLLMLTNDGVFTHEMTSPRKNVYKRYFAVLDKPMEEHDIAEFAKGMEFKDFIAKSAKLEITDNPREVYIEIAEGKFHQVKRMCERVGKTVIYLKRVAVGGVFLDAGLSPGEFREMTEDELCILGYKSENIR